MRCYIYGLVDPRDGLVRYVGQTILDPGVRRLAHVNESKWPYAISRKAQWIRELLTSGMTPDVVILEEVDQDTMDEAERKWISRLWSQPGHVTNVNGAPDASVYFKNLYQSKFEAGTLVLRPNDPDGMTAEELRAARTELGISQAALAKAIGYHYSIVSRWEAGKRPVPGRVRHLLRSLG